MKGLLIGLMALLFVGKGSAQVYKYLEEGLSSERIYAIQKDATGYMWLMTHTGLDRFDGTDIRHYQLYKGLYEEGTLPELTYLFVDSRQEVWVVGRHGDIFRYDRYADRFLWVYHVPCDNRMQSINPISCCYMDDADNVWMCNNTHIYIYHTRLQSCTQIAHDFSHSFTCMEQIDEDRFFVGTTEGVHYACIENDHLQLSPCVKLDTLSVSINEIYFHRPTQQVFMGTSQQGVIVYDLKLHQAYHLRHVLDDVRINCIRPWGKKHILLATEGAGVYRMNTTDYRCEPYIMADHEQLNGMNGNDIKDLYVDEEQRIWMAVYPLGVTVRDDHYPSYQWHRHSIGNRQSLVNDQVNAVIEDRDEDLWMATNNGISLYEGKQNRWTSFLSSYDNENKTPHHTFFTLCEVRPGIVWAGGYHSGIYQIEKRTRRVTLIMPLQYSRLNMQSNKYIRVLMKDSYDRERVWAGGNYQLMSIDMKRQETRLYEGISGVTDLAEYDGQQLWVGTAEGLYLLDKQSGKSESISLPEDAYRIQSLHYHTDGKLYIGTYQSGLFVYDPVLKTFAHYYADNSALLSNNICSILADGKGGLLFGTEQGVAYLPSEADRFYNWTRMHGLQSDHFNATSGTVRRNGHFILGSVEGAVEFPVGVFRSYPSTCQLRFIDLQIFEGADNVAELMARLDQTGTLDLNYRQHTLSLRATAINYNYNPCYLYTWRLAGQDTAWTHPVPDGEIRLRRLPIGNHLLQVRVVSNEDRRLILDERQVLLRVARPLWLSFYIGGPLILLMGVSFGIYFRYRRRQKVKPLSPADASSDVVGQNEADQRFMENVRCAINAHIDDTGYNIDDLCSQMHMSRTSFYNKIKAVTGMPPADYVRQMRLQLAAELLLTHQYTVTEVAERSGFNDAKYFREVFKKYYGVSPTQYAKGMKPTDAK